jgi:uncharacterized protein (DUF2164 family)
MQILKILIIFTSFLGSNILSAQATKIIKFDTLNYQNDSVREEIMEIDGKIITALISECDTIILASLDNISITDFRTFESSYDYRRYKKLREYAVKVYPYAAKAIKIFKETEYATQNMKKKKRKKHIRRLQKQLKEEFEDPLKKLTKSQGKLIIKMIERELDESFYNLLKGLRGGFQAVKWNTASKLYGYNLKKQYIEGEDPILDAVLQDFNVSYKIEQ